MQRVLAEEVRVGLETLAIDGEPPLPDAVGVAAGDRAEMGRVRRIMIEALETEDERMRVSDEAQILKETS